MRLGIGRKVVAAALGLSSLVSASTATACAICVIGSDSFIVSHPHALRIAAATRQSIDRGEIDEGAIQEMKEFHAALGRVAGLLSYSTDDSHATVIDFVVVDESHAFRVEIKGGRTDVKLLDGTEPPSPHGRVITTVPTVLGLANRDMNLSQAIRDGLVEIERGTLNQSRTDRESKPTTTGESEEVASE